MMKLMLRIGVFAMGIGIGLLVAAYLVSGLSIVSADGEIDLVVDAKAPTYVDVGDSYVVNVSYANVGSEGAPDNWLVVTLPTGTQFVESTYMGGEPRPPDVINGNVLTWTLTPLWAGSTWGHTLITLQTDDTLSENASLPVEVTIATSAYESDMTNNTVIVISNTSYLGGSMKQVHARYGMPGDVLTYTITIDLDRKAGGAHNGRFIILTDTLPSSDQVRFLGWSSSETGTLIEGHKLQWQGEVFPGEPVQLQYQLGIEGDVPPGAAIVNMATLDWEGQQIQLGPVETAVTLPDNMISLGPNQGGQLQHQYGMTLTVPGTAVTDTTRFQFQPIFTDTHPVDPPGGLKFANRAFELNAYRFGEPVGQFNAPLTITLIFSDCDVIGLKRETLHLWTRTGPGASWQLLGEPTQMTPNSLTVTTTHFSQFALFGEVGNQIYLPLIVQKAN